MIGSPVNIVSEIHSVKVGYSLPHDIPFGNIGRVMDIIRRENGFLTPFTVLGEIFSRQDGAASPPAGGEAFPFVRIFKFHWLIFLDDTSRMTSWAGFRSLLLQLLREPFALLQK